MWGKIISIQKFAVPHETYTAGAAEEIGLQIACKTNEGDELYRVQLVAPSDEADDVDCVIGLA
jgi:hypothetical protein